MPGDTLGAIAVKFNSTVDAIVKATDGAWELRGDPWRVARLQALLAEAEQQSQWGRKLEALIEMEPYEDLRGTTDRDIRALLTKALYAALNRVELFPNVRACHREGYWCEWVYPYGFVPEGGCPRHD
jgi:hypothetical protein